MKRRSPVRLFVSAAVVLALGFGVGLYARAAMNVPKGLAYAGMLRDGNGNPVSGMHRFDFDLVDGNSVVCSDTGRMLTLAGGRFDVPDLFAVNNCALDTALASRGGLAVNITIDGTLLQPPQPLGTVPFAARARFAEQPVVPEIAGGRLTLSTTDPAPAADQVGVGTLRYLPYSGQLTSLYDGASWSYHDIGASGVSHSLAQLPAATVYDVFLFDSGNGLDLDLAAWMNPTTRMTALARQDGVLVKGGDPTRRYLGTIRTSAAGVSEDSVLRRFVWNVQNRVVRHGRTSDPTATWGYNQQAPVPMDGGNANWRHELVIGLDDDIVDATAAVMVTGQNGVSRANIGIGLDATNAFAADATIGSINAGTDCGQTMYAQFHASVGVGYHYLQALMNTCGGSIIYYGSQGGQSQMSTQARM